ncbi:MAG: hypothetical protein PHH77_10510 [Victivallaceae bacterium]|nr:hypothetical protein [Victivallaceae bacterium]
MELQCDAIGFPAAIEAVKLLSLDGRLKHKLLVRLGRMGIAQAKKNVRDQKTVDGTAMKARKRPPPRERLVYHRDGSATAKKAHADMLHDLVANKWLGLKFDEDEVTLHFFRNAGYVAWRHQYGADTYYKLVIQAKFPEADYKKKCNRQQALELVKAGLRQNGRLVSREWIMQHITVEHALNLLKQVKRSWKIATPARPFLGAGPEQIRIWGKAIMTDLEARFRAKQYRHLLI